MLTYNLSEGKKSLPLYEQLYKNIKTDIISGKLESGAKLPSKRNFAKNLGISTITVESAYEMLLSEGFIFSVPKSGYFVSENPPDAAFFTEDDEGETSKNAPESEEKADFDFESSATLPSLFPFSAWAHLTRKVLSEKKEVLRASPSFGTRELQKAIKRHLEQFRALKVSEEQIVIGAGTEYLYSLIIQFLGANKTYAVEEPGYQKISEVYRAHNIKTAHIALDSEGIDMSALRKSGADVAHISPSHHFPTGITTTILRRKELLEWAGEKEGRFIIEDDYDSELRLDGFPVPALQSIDNADKVIYINTFSKTLSSTLRVSYMVLPSSLVSAFSEKLGFYSNTVPVINQHTLAFFMNQGFFEKHINRLRRNYTQVRDFLLEGVKANDKLKTAQISQENSGLHFLLCVKTEKSDESLTEQSRKIGIKISFLSKYFFDKEKSPAHTLVINYSSIPADKKLIFDALERLSSIL